MTQMTFDWFTPGQLIGRSEVALDAQMFARWFAIFPQDETDAEAGRMPMGLSAPLLMQAYAAILHGKPKGNVHGGQLFSFAALPRLGDVVVSEMRCLGKRLSGQRKWLELGIRSAHPDGTLYWNAKMTVLWAE